MSKPDDDRTDPPGLEPFNNLIRRMLAIPPKPHSEMKLGKPRGRGRTKDRTHEEAHVHTARKDEP